jgi:hypothetical protein
MVGRAGAPRVTPPYDRSRHILPFLEQKELGLDYLFMARELLGLAWMGLIQWVG